MSPFKSDRQRKAMFAKMRIYQLQALNESKGKFFFSPSTTRFFRSRYPDEAYRKGNYAYFVTSEQGPDGIRKWTIRQTNLSTGATETAAGSQFQEFGSTREATAALRQRYLQ